jgi:hypothetical protein
VDAHPENRCAQALVALLVIVILQVVLWVVGKAVHFLLICGSKRVSPIVSRLVIGPPN